jgi:hypothetical protein
VTAAAAVSALTPAQRRRLITRGLLRALAGTVVLVALYFLLPLDRIDSVPLEVSLAVALLVLLGVSIWQVRAITRAAHPGVAPSERSPSPRRYSCSCSRPPTSSWRKPTPPTSAPIH